MNFDSFRVMSFDCYGTLIDWETGILDALSPLRSLSSRDTTDDELLELYATAESRIQSGEYRKYRDVLRLVTADVAAALGVAAGRYDPDALPDSIAGWRPFPDTVDSLSRLKRRYELVVLSNIDDDIFAKTALRLGVTFDHVITAEQAQSYKPSHNNFHLVLERIGRQRHEVLHVAQSLFHDIKPARELGIATVWVNRRGGREGGGATYPAEARPDLEVPDLASLVRLVEQSS